MNDELKRFGFPEQSEELRIDEALLPVIERISRYLPEEEVRRRFTSAPQSTGGISRFPYFRVDLPPLYIGRDYLDDPGPISEEIQDYYNNASNYAMEAILWVEIGFQGLENLAVSPASKNWTTNVGHFVDDKQRAKGIMTEGKKVYDSFLRKFAQFRTSHGITDDCFAKFHLEHLLDKWK